MIFNYAKAESQGKGREGNILYNGSGNASDGKDLVQLGPFNPKLAMGKS